MPQPSVLRLLSCAFGVAVLAITACRGPSESGRSNGGFRRGQDLVENMGAPMDGPQAFQSHEAVEDGAGYDATIPIVMLELGRQRVSRDGKAFGVLKVIDDHDGPHADLHRRDIAMQSGVSLELHGHSSGTLAKKSYQIELVDDQRKDHELPLLGLPPGSDWVLHNCGFDPICVRNSLAFDLAQKLGHYAPRTRVLELFVDGKYQGLYMLIERVRRHEQRVDLPKPSNTRRGGDITGGYVFRMDLGEGAPEDQLPRDWVSPISRTVYSYHYPRYDRITNEQRAYLHDHVARFEALMRSERWNNATTGYRRWLDMRSWVDFALIQELALNPDAYFKSIYLQKWPRSRGDKIAIGPLWDFDLAFGLGEFRGARDTESWAHAMNRFGGERVAHDPSRRSPYVPEYWVRLWTDPDFHDALQCRWQELRRESLRVPALHRQIDGWVNRLGTVLSRDAARWPDLPKNAWTGGADALKMFLEKRIAWMDDNLPGRCSAEKPDS